MKRTLACLLVLVMLLVGCSSGDSFPHFDDGTTVGKGKTDFNLVITDTEGEKVTLTIKTDSETVGEALQKEHVIFGTEGEYGLFIETVNGQTLDYDKDGYYWAFYIDGTYAEKGIDLTSIQSDTVYELRAEKM